MWKRYDYNFQAAIIIMGSWYHGIHYDSHPKLHAAYTSHFCYSTQHNTTYVKKPVEDNNTMDEIIQFLAVCSTS